MAKAVIWPNIKIFLYCFFCLNLSSSIGATPPRVYYAREKVGIKFRLVQVQVLLYIRRIQSHPDVYRQFQFFQ